MIFREDISSNLLTTILHSSAKSPLSPGAMLVSEMLLVRGLRGDCASVDTLGRVDLGTVEQWPPSTGTSRHCGHSAHVTLSSHPTTADTQPMKMG